MARDRGIWHSPIMPRTPSHINGQRRTAEISASYTYARATITRRTELPAMRSARSSMRSRAWASLGCGRCSTGYRCGLGNNLAGAREHVLRAGSRHPAVADCRSPSAVPTSNPMIGIVTPDSFNQDVCLRAPLVLGLCSRGHHLLERHRFPRRSVRVRLERRGPFRRDRWRSVRHRGRLGCKRLTHLTLRVSRSHDDSDPESMPGCDLRR